MSIRSFTLKNSNGIIWDLNNTDSFFTEIDGMGHERDYNFESVGNYHVEIASELKQAEPRGIIRFSNYQKCNDFIKFIQASPLILSYTMPGVSTVYSLKVRIRKFEKKEIEAGNLPCDISFLGIGQYYKTLTVEKESTITTGKVYTYTYPYTYSDNASGEVTLQSDSILDSPCRLIIFGPCINPSWSHYVNDIITTSGKVNCTVSTGERLIIDSTSIPYSIKKYDGFMNLISDCYADSDFSTGRFVNLKLGENKIAFMHEGSDELKVTVEALIQYESV